MNRNVMIGKILSKTPGIYLHISFRVIGWIIFFALIITIFCVERVNITYNPEPKQYPVYLDGIKINFIGRDPISIKEARDIISRFNHKLKDGDRVYVPE